MTVVGRLDDGDNRWYLDPTSGAKYESVTHILSASKSRPWLAGWSGRITAETAVEHLDLLVELVKAEGRGPAAAWLAKASERRRALKREIGTYVHDVIEALILDVGSLPDPPEYLLNPDGTPLVIDGESVDLDVIVDGFTAFDRDYSPRYEMAEATVANTLHGYAGTLDFLATFPHLGRGGIDTKSGLLDDDAAAQLGAYRACNEVWLNQDGDRAPMPAWDFAAVLHIRTDYAKGYKLLRVDADGTDFDWFLAARKVLGFARAAKPIRGRPIYPPRADGSQPPLLVEDSLTIARYTKALTEVGATDVELLSCMSVEALLALEGVGPAAVLAIVEALAGHGLTLDGPGPCAGSGGQAVGGSRREGRRIMGTCPTCGASTSADKAGVVRFHVQAPAEEAS